MRKRRKKGRERGREEGGREGEKEGGEEGTSPLLFCENSLCSKRHKHAVKSS